MAHSLFQGVDVMAELPSGLLEACVVVGVHSEKLRDIYQVHTLFTHSQTETVIIFMVSLNVVLQLKTLFSIANNVLHND